MSAMRLRKQREKLSRIIIQAESLYSTTLTLDENSYYTDIENAAERATRLARELLDLANQRRKRTPEQLRRIAEMIRHGGTFQKK